MAITPKKIIEAQITAATGAIAYPGQVGVRTRITNATICNTETATPYTFNCYVVPSGGAAGATNKKINARTVHGGETYTCPELIGLILEPGDIIDFDTSTTLKLNCDISATEM